MLVLLPRLIAVTGVGVASGYPIPRPRQKDIKMRIETRLTADGTSHGVAVGFVWETLESERST